MIYNTEPFWLRYFVQVPSGRVDVGLRLCSSLEDASEYLCRMEKYIGKLRGWVIL